MAWKPMSVEQGTRVDAITPSAIEAGATKARFTLHGANLPAEPVVWMYWHGQPVLKATVLGQVEEGGRTVLDGEVDLEGWELDKDISLRVLVGRPDGTFGVWSDQELTLKAS